MTLGGIKALDSLSRWCWAYKVVSSLPIFLALDCVTVRSVNVLPATVALQSWDRNIPLEKRGWILLRLETTLRSLKTIYQSPPLKILAWITGTTCPCRPAIPSLLLRQQSIDCNIFAYKAVATQHLNTSCRGSAVMLQCTRRGRYKYGHSHTSPHGCDTCTLPLSISLSKGLVVCWPANSKGLKGTNIVGRGAMLNTVMQWLLEFTTGNLEFRRFREYVSGSWKKFSRVAPGLHLQGTLKDRYLYLNTI